MRFTNSVIINRPVDEVFRLFNDPQYLGEYQDGKREMIITETILVSNAPEEFVGSYHHKHMDNAMRFSFVKLAEDQTKYVSEV